MQKELNNKELNDKELLEYITMTMSREMFPTGRPEEVILSGISLNYAFIGAASGRQRRGCTKAVEEISNSRKRLYWEARSYGKKVVGLVHETGVYDWVIPNEWVKSRKAESEVSVTFPTYEEDRCKELGGRLAIRCVKRDASYKGLVPFLGSFKGTRRQTLEENNKFCMKCLFLFYPSLLNEFCKDLITWCNNRKMGEAEYAQVYVILDALSEYLKLLEDLKPMGKGAMPLREIVNVLNRHRLQVLSYKIEKELKDDLAKDTYKKCLEENVRRGMRSTYAISNFELAINQNIRGGKELVQAFWEIKNLAESIRKLE